MKKTTQSKIERAYLSFSELMERWDCSENDLRYLLIEGLIKPSHLVDGDIRISDTKSERLRGFYYLLDPYQTAPFDCEYGAFAESRSEEVPFKLVAPISLSFVLSDCVILWSEVLLYEEGVSGPTPDDDSINPKAMDSMLKLIIGMAIDGYGYRPGAKRNDAVTVIEDALKDIGLKTDDETIRKWLYVSAEKFVPVNSEYRVTYPKSVNA